METIWAAIITTGGAIVVAITGGLFARARQASARSKAYDQVSGLIVSPETNQAVSRTFKCSGSVTGMQSGLQLWLAIEVEERVWPRESRVALDQRNSNKWKGIIFEDGASSTFKVSLYVGDAKVDKRIEKWLEAGRKTGKYPEFKGGIPGARRLHRIEGLTLE